jgi:hypothetical protein
MAKQKTNPMSGLFKKTEAEEQPAADQVDVSKETTRPIGVYLSKEDKVRLQEIASKEGFSRHAILQFAILHFLREYEAGRVELPTQTVRAIKKP